jgi:hypothetical protein
MRSVGDVASWTDVEKVALELPETTKDEAHEGSPAIYVRTQQFARLRWDDTGGEILQFWVPDEDLVQAYVEADPAAYFGAAGYSRKVVMARLRMVDETTMRELLVESWICRATATLRRQHADLR